MATLKVVETDMALDKTVESDVKNLIKIVESTLKFYRKCRST